MTWTSTQPVWGNRVVSYAEAARAVGIAGGEWHAPDWAKTAYGAAPADQIVDALRAVAGSEANREAVVAARRLGGWRAAEDFVRGLLAQGATP